MDRQQEQVVVVGEPDEQGPQRRPGGQVEGFAGLLDGHVEGLPFAVGVVRVAQVAYGQGYLARRQEDGRAAPSCSSKTVRSGSWRRTTAVRACRSRSVSSGPRSRSSSGTA
ncbi:hypothetical protein NKH77_46600 [Streptomyces sp. M19]